MKARVVQRRILCCRAAQTVAGIYAAVHNTGMILHNHWQTTPPDLETCSKLTALLEAQSLTAALRRLDAVFSVRLLHLGETGFDRLFEGEGVWQQLAPAAPMSYFARDVLLCLNDTPVVWARSLCRADAVVWRNLLNCGTRPLGELLFDGTLPLTRSPFEYTVSGSAALAGCHSPTLAARRSAFTLEGRHLGLIEAFLPTLCDFTAK